MKKKRVIIICVLAVVAALVITFLALNGNFAKHARVMANAGRKKCYNFFANLHY